MERSNGSGDDLHKHLARFWPGDQETFEWTIGPIKKTLPGFSVVRIKPKKSSDPWIYVSHGAAAVDTRQGYGLEFMLMSPVPDPIHVENLAMAANFHADPKYRLGLGRTVAIGRPWIGGSTGDHFLVSLPYTVGPEFEWHKTKAGLIRILWLLPITSAEAAFAGKQGVEALEAKFEQTRFNVLDPGRQSVV